MLDFIRGFLVRKSPSEVVVDVGGVGFVLQIPGTTYDSIGQPGEKVSLLAKLIHREDTMELYGFATEIERGMFDLLLGVSGIGPKMAIKILAGMGADEIAESIRSRDYKRLTTIPGLGRKKAEKICLELESKVGKLPLAKSGGVSRKLGDAVDALAALGYPRPRAAEIVREIAKETGEKKTEEIIRLALAKLAKRS